MRADLLTNEHLMFRDAFRRFAAKEITPHHPQWEKDGLVPRDLWQKAGAAGFLCMDVPETYGGLGAKDFRYNAIISEELVRAAASGPGFAVHTDMVAPYISQFGTEEQKRRWLPGLVSGQTIAAIAMSEPNTGSDVAAVQTTAVRHAHHYLLNGQKTFISNGILNDLVIVAAKTNPQAGAKGVSLIVVERNMAGYERGRNLDKIGMHAQDTAELFFHDVHVPFDNLIGQENMGFIYLMQRLPQERLTIAVGAIAAAEIALEWTVAYCQQRTAFGRPIGKFQNSRFKLAEMKTEIEIGRTFVDHCISLHNRGDLSVEQAAMAKWWTTDLQVRVIDQCLQLHGGYGYMMEYPIAKAYIDSRAQKIYGGSNEIMKEIIGRAMGF
ncbi:MAG: acyl-CoA dehydrogenase family protein [Chloroflexi bacterium]|nr:acyl-CoA dehydrogenase family protein [Chloroflexota bacterium]MBK6708778.1 acyl-CoA dehydrogenase family protein [Chloroflexota bacterium]MBK7917135.1 acyl-CoA dehydrogenase family protein [Chloroflexota bacterium]MBP6803800.1 acyl-CoA dehydrogenase family protein [Chloroflexota bacterium]MBP7591979.1 acyl-CoA dehydrogenase family protein [Chloroflexota bacterium]